MADADEDLDHRASPLDVPVHTAQEAELRLVSIDSIERDGEHAYRVTHGSATT